MTDYRWFDSPRSIGARYVGRADELVKLGHAGWYLSDDFQDETAWGVVWQLPARKGRPVYLAGFQTSLDCDSKGAAFELPLAPVYGVKGPETIHLTDDMTVTEVARLADDCARIYAESEREYQRKSDAAMNWRDTFEEEKEAKCAVKHARRYVFDNEGRSIGHGAPARGDLAAELAQNGFEFA